MLSILSFISSEYDKTNDYKVYNSLLPSLLRFYMFTISNIQLEIANKRSDKESFNLTFKRVIILSLLFWIIPAIIIWNHIGLVLDDYLYPNWNKQLVKEPLFIVGNARSGTTYLHRLLSYNDETFTTMKTWEILLAVSITWKKLFYHLYHLDLSYLNGFITYQLISKLDSYFFSHITIHPIGVFEPEEDEWLMLHIFSSQLYLLFNPLGLHIDEKYSKLSKMIIFDKLDINQILPKRIRHFIIQYYKECIQKHLYFQHQSNPHRNIIYLSKNPPFTMRLHSLYYIFPDARFICLIRDPVDSIPSMVSYISCVWKTFSDPNQKYPNTKDLIGFCELHYLYPIEFVENTKIPSLQWSFVSYHKLINHLADTIEAALHHLYDINTYRALTNNKFYRIINQEIILNKKFSSSHEHSVESCCQMTSNELKDLMFKVYEVHKQLLNQ